MTYLPPFLNHTQIFNFVITPMKNELNKTLLDLAHDAALKDKVIIVGADEVEATSIQAVIKKHHKAEVIVVNDLESTPKILEINGKKYHKREQKRPRRNTSKFLLMAEMMSMGHSMMGGFESKERKRPTVNIEKEFELIQNKKSNLSRNDRDWVVNTFKYLYEEII